MRLSRKQRGRTERPLERPAPQKAVIDKQPDASTFERAPAFQGAPVSDAPLGFKAILKRGRAQKRSAPQPPRAEQKLAAPELTRPVPRNGASVHSVLSAGELEKLLQRSYGDGASPVEIVHRNTGPMFRAAQTTSPKVTHLIVGDLGENTIILEYIEGGIGLLPSSLTLQPVNGGPVYVLPVNWTGDENNGTLVSLPGATTFQSTARIESIFR